MTHSEFYYRTKKVKNGRLLESIGTKRV